ncbi:MAG: FAD-dependent oxidoreductase, partial [Candidatus Nanopelagicales bacterium]|nr:FAD-dependent oxidoreductase [Candidatus Nanopelagicales bacterium]
RILDWKQIWNLTEVPERLIVVGSGVTGAEFAGAFVGIGAEVVLVSSRARVLPTQDPDAAAVVEEVFTRRGMRVMGHSRAVAVERESDGVVVTMKDGSEVSGSHCLLAVGIVPNTDRMGLVDAGIKLADNGSIEVDRVSRTNVMGVYAAGDATGVMALASVAAMQGRIAMWHALGDAVEPLDLAAVSSAVFTDPEIAAVGVTAADIESGRVPGRVQFQPLATNPRAKMQGVSDGFVKLMASPDGTIIGGAVVAPHASDLIHVLAVAVRRRLTVDDIAGSYSVYPSMSGSVGEAARRLHSVAG